jgi:hypothetical protein
MSLARTLKTSAWDEKKALSPQLRTFLTFISWLTVAAVVLFQFRDLLANQ